MALVQLTCVEYGNYYVNPANVTFISCGEEIKADDGSVSQQIFIHFSGGKESAMLMVASVEKAIAALNA